jgi:hypothetical protein
MTPRYSQTATPGKILGADGSANYLIADQKSAKLFNVDVLIRHCATACRFL